MTKINGGDISECSSIAFNIVLKPRGRSLGTYTILYCMLLYFTTLTYCTLLLYYLPHPILHLHIKSRENLCCGFNVIVVLQKAPGAQRTMVTIRKNVKFLTFRFHTLQLQTQLGVPAAL